MNTLPVVWSVDDDEDDQYLIGEALKQAFPFIALRQLSDGDELIKALQQALIVPGLVLLDLNMKRMDGFETLRQLRLDPTYHQLPVVVLTTSSNRQDQEKSFQLGANGFKTKPSSQQELTRLLQALVEQWQVSS